MATRGKNAGPGAMTGVDQLQVNLYHSQPLGPSSDARRQDGRHKPGTRAGDTPEVPVRREQMAGAWGGLSDPYVRQCTNEVMKRLFSGQGIVVYHGDEPRPASAAFRTVLARDFVPFVRDAMQCILAFGLVPIAFKRVHGGGMGEYDLVPYVPKFGTYVLSTFSEAGQQRFRFYWAGALGGECFAAASETGPFWMTGGGGPYGERDEAVVVAHDFGFEPNVDGSLTSNLHILRPVLAFIAELRQLALTAERIASNPPIVTAYNPAIEDRAEDKFQENFYVGNPDRCLNRAEAVYQRTAQQQQLFQQQMEQWEACTGMDAQAEFGAVARKKRGAGEMEGPVPPAWGRDWRGCEMPWARQYYLDATRQLVQQQLPRTRTDLEALSNQAMELVCGVLNVPRGLLASDSHVQAGVEAVAEAMHRTVNQWADMLSALLTAIYNHTFGIADLRDELRVRAESRRRSPLDRAAQLLTEEDLFEAEAKTRVRLGFDLPPVTTPERLDALYNREIITWKTYAGAQLRLHGFGRDQLAHTSDPLTKEERRELLLGPPKAEGAAGGAKKKPKKKKDAGQQAAKASKKRAAAGAK